VQDKDIEFEYNPRRAVANMEQHARRAESLSATTREKFACILDLKYGARNKASFDLFRCHQAEAPVHVFIHGGYWRGRDKSDYSFIANALVPQGIHTIVLNYDLCPEVELPFIVSQVRQGLLWLRAHMADLDLKPSSFTASGHSAGAHLIAAALMQSVDKPALTPLVDAAVLVSGIYELAPVLSISVNKEIKLREDQVDSMSPMRHEVRHDCPLWICVGGAETDAFRTQSREFATHCSQSTNTGLITPFVEFSGLNHYTVMQQLERSDSPLAKLIGLVCQSQKLNAA